MTASPSAPHVGLVVEGRGDEYALPPLLRRWLYRSEMWADILGKPIPCHGREKALAPNGLEGYVATAAGRPGCVGVLVVLDAENDAACELGPGLTTRAQAVTGKPVAVCLAEPKYEGWLVASAETMELTSLTYSTTRDPGALIVEALRPAKYVKPTWQPRLSERLDFDLACGRASSLKRTLEKFDGLTAHVEQTPE